MNATPIILLLTRKFKRFLFAQCLENLPTLLMKKEKNRQHWQNIFFYGIITCIEVGFAESFLVNKIVYMFTYVKILLSSEIVASLHDFQKLPYGFLPYLKVNFFAKKLWVNTAMLRVNHISNRFFPHLVFW